MNTLNEEQKARIVELAREMKFNARQAADLTALVAAGYDLPESCDFVLYAGQGEHYWTAKTRRMAAVVAEAFRIAQGG